MQGIWDHGETGSHNLGKVEFWVRFPMAPLVERRSICYDAYGSGTA
jgi:hypothetical protein